MRLPNAWFVTLAYIRRAVRRREPYCFILNSIFVPFCAFFAGRQALPLLVANAIPKDGRRGIQALLLLLLRQFAVPWEAVNFGFSPVVHPLRW
jgi:hypothetical protein